MAIFYRKVLKYFLLYSYKAYFVVKIDTFYYR